MRPESTKEVAGGEEIAAEIHDWSLMWRLLRLLGPYWLEVTGSVTCALIGTSLQILNPLVLSLAIDTYFLHRPPVLQSLKVRLPADPRHGVTLLALVFVAGVLLSLISESLQAFFAQWSGQKAMADLRRRIFEHLQRLPMQFYDVTPVGRLVTRTTTDVEALNDLYTNGIVSVLANGVMSLLFLVAVVRLNSRLGMVLGLILPLFTVITLVFRRIITRSQQRGRILLAKINSFIAENVSGIDVVHLFNRQKPHLRKFDELNSSYNRISKQWVTANAWFMPVVELLGTISQAALLFLGAWMLQQGALTIGIIVAFLQYATRFLKPIQEIGERYGVLQSSVVSAEKVFALLDTPASAMRAMGERPRLPMGSEVEFDHVWFAYKPGQWILRDVSFRAGPGESLAIAGHTGAGKTTIINLLLRFYEPQRGVIRVGGVDIRTIGVKELRRQFGVVLQDGYVREGSILDNIRFGAQECSEQQVIDAAEKVGLLTIAKHFSDGLETKVHERGENLSSGQKQLLAFARALAHDPKCLILDEATSSVDSGTESRMQKALDSFLHNRTSIIIAHRLSTIVSADRIVVMHKGRVAETGNHETLVAQAGLYWRLYQLQSAESA